MSKLLKKIPGRIFVMPRWIWGDLTRSFQVWSPFRDRARLEKRGGFILLSSAVTSGSSQGVYRGGGLVVRSLQRGWWLWWARSLSAGPQSDYSPFSPIWTGHGRFRTLFSNEARHKLRPFWSGASQMESIVCKDLTPWDLEYTRRLPFDALWTVSETTAVPAFPAFLLVVAAS